MTLENGEADLKWYVIHYWSLGYLSGRWETSRQRILLASLWMSQGQGRIY